MNYILVINPGSTSTKIAIFKEEIKLFETNMEHNGEELKTHSFPEEQWLLRRDALINWLREVDFDFSLFNAIAARGGVIGQLNSGAYQVNEALKNASLHSSTPHASNLAAVIAYDFALKWGIPAYIYDAVCGMGEPNPIYTYSGLKELPRPFLTHVLNTRAVGFHHAQIQEEDLFQKTYIVTHLGGGITTNLVVHGQIVDFVGDDEGTFSPERSGGLPARSLVKIAFSGKYTQRQLQTKLKGQGGLVDYFATSDFRIIEKMAIEDQNKQAQEVIEAMALQIAKDIGSMATVSEGAIDALILTGGLAHSSKLCQLIEKRVRFIAPLYRYPGSFEMEALAKGVLRVLRGEETAHQYIEEFE
jgi:butyrate kinase